MDIKKILGAGNPYAQNIVDRGEETSSASKVERVKAKLKNASESSSGDKVSLSGDARLVAQAVKEAAGSSDVRMDRVEALKQQVQSGTYQPDSRKIAQKLIDNEIDFLQ